jgi:ABC-type phosphate/phosphonate transport system substrate-binding protein
MCLQQRLTRFRTLQCLLLPLVLAILFSVWGTTSLGQPTKIDKLRIGATGTFTGNADSAKEKAGHATLQQFIKEETGLTNEVLRQKDWKELTDKLAKGQLHLALFQGHEFAWAQEKHAELRPLVVAVNVYRYTAAHVLARSDNPAQDFAGLKGQSLMLPVTNQDFLRLYLERQCQATGKKVEEFFSTITAPENVEDALDDLVDGKGQIVVVDEAAVEAYKRRKPGRFNKLKEVVRSQPFPPGVIAYHGTILDDATLRRFKSALLSASRKEKGEMLLTLSRLTTFETVPDDLQRVLVEMRKAYPSEAKAK